MGVGGEGRVGAIRGEGRSAATYCRQEAAAAAVGPSAVFALCKSVSTAP